MSYLQINHSRERMICAASNSSLREVLQPSKKGRLYLNVLNWIQKLDFLHLGMLIFRLGPSDFFEPLNEEGI